MIKKILHMLPKLKIIEKIQYNYMIEVIAESQLNYTFGFPTPIKSPKHMSHLVTLSEQWNGLSITITFKDHTQFIDLTFIETSYKI